MADVSVAALLLRLVISMVVVLALMLVAAKVLRRANTTVAGKAAAKAGGKAGTPITVVAQAPLGKGISVAVVHTAGRELVLGITPQQVSLLAGGVQPVDRHDGDDGRARAQRTDLTDAVRRALVDDASTPHPTTARIAAAGSERSDGERALSAWTDALESLRERTLRR